MITEILYLISIREKKKARLVCHLWRMMIDSDRSVVFRPILASNSTMEYFLKSYRSMDKVIIRNINMRMSKADFEFPRVKNVELGWKNSEGHIERFLTQGCEHAESLTLAKFSLERISRGAISKVLAEINWKNLSQFKVVVTTSNYKDARARKHLRNVTALLKYARIPALQELEFNFCFRYGFSKKHKLQYEKLFMGLYHFLVGHSKTLKMLTGQIKTTSQCTVEIPEIPTDLQQSLVSNIKLQQCSLTLCGVRRLDSIINPAIFGSVLKILDIRIYPSCIGQRVRWDLSELTFTNKLIHNLELIFEKNGKTLTKVSLHMRRVYLTLLINCIALESLELDYMSTVIEPEDLNRLSHIVLKSFSALYNDHEYLSPGLLQLLDQSIGTLEHLSLFWTGDIMSDDFEIQFWLRDYVALKSLKLDRMCIEYIDENTGGQFPYLTELEIYIDDETRRTIETWITESMRNLEIVTITGSVDIQFLQTLYTLPKLKQISYGELWTNPPPTNVTEEMKELYEISDATFTTTKVRGWPYRFYTVTIYRAADVNPINN